MEILMDWLTIHGNCASPCGVTGNKGTSKTQCHKEIALLIKTKRPDSERNEKDVENKIGSLERAFRTASDWANNTGQGVEDPGDFEAAVKKCCPLYYELEDIMVATFLRQGVATANMIAVAERRLSSEEPDDSLLYDEQLEEALDDAR